jgi:PhnB protein
VAQVRVRRRSGCGAGQASVPFLIAFERRSTFERDRDSARPWLYGIAANLMAKHHRSESRRLRAMARVSARRVLPDDPPDPETLVRGKARLMSAITGPVGAASAAGVAGQRRSPSIYPRLAYRDEVAALDFLTRAFGLVERREARMEHPDGMLAWLEIGDGMVMIGRAGEEHHGLHSPLDVGALTAMVNVYVHDIDAHYRRAEAEGARIVMPLEEMFWGDRRYEAVDPEGHRWHFAERVTRTPDQPGELPGAAALPGVAGLRDPPPRASAPGSRPACGPDSRPPTRPGSPNPSDKPVRRAGQKCPVRITN